jgi:MFS family permease
LSSFRSATRLVFSNRNLMVVTLTQSLSMFATFIWRPFWSLYILELGGSKSVLGALATLQTFSTLILQLPGGALADRFGRRRIIIAASLFGFIPPLIFRLSTHWTMLIPGIVASSISALAVPARNALIAESLPPENRAIGFGAYTMSWYIFIVVSYPLGGYLMDQMGVVHGVHLGLIISFLVMLPIVLIQWRFIIETLKTTSPIDINEKSKNQALLSQLKDTPTEIWKLIIVAILSSFGFQIFWSFVVVYCTEVLSLSKMQWSIASVIANLLAACFMMPTGFFSDRAKRKPYIILSQMLVSLASLGYVLSSSFYGIIFTRILGGVGEGLGGNVMSSVGGPIWQTLVTEVAPANIRGSVIGLTGTFTGFICTPAPWIGGLLYEHISPQTPFFVSFALGLTGCVIFALFVKEPEERLRA